jgi:hypothetical protein
LYRGDDQLCGSRRRVVPSGSRDVGMADGCQWNDSAFTRVSNTANSAGPRNVT